ncbi:MAG: DUF3822 family protein [Bacteroidetes bacterium]|nr:MAG: DUF3822 family protein [Bacteroidota bacterium]
MGQLNLEILESDFNKKSTSAYELSILFGMDSFLYSVTDDKNRILLLRDFSVAGADAQLAALDEDPLLPLLFRKAKVAFQSPAHCLVPDRLFHDAHKATYLTGVAGEVPPETVQSCPVPVVPAHLVFQPEPALFQKVKSLIPTAHFYHMGCPLILSAHKMGGFSKDQVLFVNIRDRFIQIVLFEKRNLLLFNQNRFETSRDALYHLLLVFSQFKLSTEETPVWVSGQIMENSELYTLFYRYIKNLQLVPAPDFVQLGKRFGKTSPHLYYDLFSLCLCH